jgi:hypothetical protein
MHRRQRFSAAKERDGEDHQISTQFLIASMRAIATILSLGLLAAALPSPSKGPFHSAQNAKLGEPRR